MAPESTWGAVLVASVTSTFSLIGTIITAVMAYFLARLSSRAATAEIDRKQVKETLMVATKLTDEKLGKLAEVAADTHTLVNSNMGLQLKISESALRRVAQLTNDEADIAAWNFAKKALAEHDKKQAVVDSGAAK